MPTRSFNFRSSKKNAHPLEELSELAGGSLRPSDLDGIDPGIFLEMLRGQGKKVERASFNPYSMTRQALHGFGDGFDRQVGNGSTSPLVNLGPSIPGDRNRVLPSGGTNNTNAEDDNKNLRGRSERSDYQPTIQWNEMLEATEGKLAPKFKLKMLPPGGKVPTAELARELFGAEGRFDGREMYIIVPGRINASEIARSIGEKHRCTVMMEEMRGGK